MENLFRFSHGISKPQEQNSKSQFTIPFATCKYHTFSYSQTIPIPHNYQFMKSVFVTVGSTKFDDLVNKTSSSDFLKTLEAEGYDKLIIQHGNSTLKSSKDHSQNVIVQAFNFDKDLEEFYNQADLVISHAGSGSIMNCLRRNKKLIVVVNDSLMDNHQSELAEELSRNNYLISSTVGNLNNTIKNVSSTKLVEYPKQNVDEISNIINSI
ncbi:hypothetical protein BB559_006821 [Furculomyces boomerangus]|uniref:UDP-N-acetylglucosamine transferase subunit ALG13 n=1 Tax=Furculomyces boomerangus TaxID=61424 RepID=A0A2T9Y0J6_9FUNG|nr:hypothetical protein BB559_006821 [Furculomyces boomerangus]